LLPLSLYLKIRKKNIRDAVEYSCSLLSGFFLGFGVFFLCMLVLSLPVVSMESREL